MLFLVNSPAYNIYVLVIQFKYSSVVYFFFHSMFPLSKNLIILCWQGHFGSVKRGTYTLKGKDISIAVKVFQAMQRDMIEKEMFKEVDVLGALDNPHIVKLHGFTKKPGKDFNY